MIKVFCVKPMPYTPFGGFDAIDLPYLEKAGIMVVKSSKEADVLVAQHRKFLKPFMYRFRRKKKYLIWTLEPRFDTSFESTRKEVLGWVTCHIMNLYTGDVFVSPLSFHAKLINKQLDLLPDTFKLSSRRVVGLMSYFSGLESPNILYLGEDRDLIKLRTQIALEGHKRTLFDVYGKGWPNGISKEDSRSGNWVDRKKQLLQEYHFNLCFENTATARYVTEKIWDSIENYCLPIYYGKYTEIYTLFPNDSFIDYSDFKAPEALFEYVEAMTNKEYISRMNACVEVYNNIASKGRQFVITEREKSLKAIVEKLNMISV